MSGSGHTPPAPYYAAIFTSTRSGGPGDGYAEMAERMDDLVARQPGYLGMEHARGEDGLGITVSYWRSLDDIRAWKAVQEHAAAQQLGRERWYAAYHVRVARVEYEYEFQAAPRPNGA